MNGIRSNCQCYCTPNLPGSGTLNPGNVVDRFVAEYYRNVTSNGWNSSLYLFDHNCVVLCKDKHVGSAYDMLDAFSAEYVKKANYDQLRVKWLILNTTTLLINVFGRIQFVGSYGNVSSVTQFTETFVLNLNPSNGLIKCTHHLMDW